MRFDRFGCLIREKYEPEFHPGNTGDSAFYTGHYVVLSGDERVSFTPFIAPKVGFYRHPSLPLNPEVNWGKEDKFSGDQLVPIVCGTLTQGRRISSLRLKGNEWQIPGTSTWLTPAAWCLIRGHYRMLNLFNYAQGLILRFPWRYNDQKRALERTSGSSVDYLNMVLLWVLLRRLNKTAWLGHTKEQCWKMINVYYKTGSDPEPNVDWFLELYRQHLFDGD